MFYLRFGAVGPGPRNLHYVICLLMSYTTWFNLSITYCIYVFAALSLDLTRTNDSCLFESYEYVLNERCRPCRLPAAARRRSRRRAPEKKNLTKMTIAPTMLILATCRLPNNRQAKQDLVIVEIIEFPLSLSLCMYIYIYTYTHTYAYTYTHISLSLYIYIYTYISGAGAALVLQYIEDSFTLESSVSAAPGGPPERNYYYYYYH